MSETSVSEGSQGSPERVLFSEPPQSPGPLRSGDPLHLVEHPETENVFGGESSLPPGADPATQMIQSDQRVALQVGERRFTTNKDTLARSSHYFLKMLSGRWPHETQEDGSYFVDADGTIFEHVLRYLRHSVFPVHYDNVKGHDFGFYAALLEQARLFGVDDLEKWLENKTYFKAVRTEHRAWLLDDLNSIRDTVGSNVEHQYLPSWIIERVYVCPRGITVHRGNPDACGRACKNAQGDAADEFVKESELKIVAIEKKTIFVQEMCFDGSVYS